jgi:hypothetical protein
MLDHMTLTQAVRLLGPSKPTLSPMQQALRRAIIDEAVSDEARTVRAIIWSIARESGLNEKVLFTCLGAMLIPKDRNTNQT